MPFLLLLKSYWKPILTGAVIIFLLIGVAVLYSRCKPQPKIDLETVNKINTADEKDRKAIFEQTIKENLDVIKSTETGTALTEVAVDERNRQIAEKIAQAEKKVVESKNQGKDVTQEELECILVPEHCQ